MRGNSSGIKYMGRSVFFDSCGYPKIKLNNKSRSVHSLEWEKHHGKVPSGLTINHKDGDKMNWNVENLELLTQGDNVRHAWSIGLCSPKLGENHGRAVLDDMKVLTILTMPKRKKNGHPPGWSNIELAAKYGISVARISNIRNGREWRHLPRP